MYPSPLTAFSGGDICSCLDYTHLSHLLSDKSQRMLPGACHQAGSLIELNQITGLRTVHLESPPESSP